MGKLNKKFSKLFLNKPKVLKLPKHLVSGKKEITILWALKLQVVYMNVYVRNATIY